MGKLIAVIIGIILALVTAVGDALIKKATLKETFSDWPLVVVAAIIYGLTAFGWFYVFKKIEMSSAVVIYTVGLVLAVVFIGAFYFNEDVNFYEKIGVALAVASIIMMAKFV